MPKLRNGQKQKFLHLSITWRCLKSCLNNSDGLYFEGFIKALQRDIPHIDVKEIDERFTSVMAMDAMIAGGMKKKDRRVKGNVDKVSAAIILQSYMESRR